MNKAITLTEVRSEAMETIKALKNKEMDVKTASEIRSLLSVIVDTAKAQVEFIKALPDQFKDELNSDTIKSISVTFEEKEATLESTLIEIENNKKKPYEFSK